MSVSIYLYLRRRQTKQPDLQSVTFSGWITMPGRELRINLDDLPWTCDHLVD